MPADKDALKRNLAMQQAELLQSDAHGNRRNHELLGKRSSKIVQNVVICRTDRISEPAVIRSISTYGCIYRHLRS